MKWIVYLLAVALFIAHQDYWNFQKHDPMWMGIIPIGLWFHALFAVCCSVLMLLLVIFAWPKHLEEFEKLPDHPGARGH